MENNGTFQFTYSAKEQEEIKNIRKKYTAPNETEDKMTLLRRLDAKVYSKAKTVSVTIGIIGTLIMGLGMSLVMTDIGSAIGKSNAMAVGVSVGVLGLVFVCFAYPVYKLTLKKVREKVAPEILHLADELLK